MDVGALAWRWAMAATVCSVLAGCSRVLDAATSATGWLDAAGVRTASSGGRVPVPPPPCAAVVDGVEGAAVRAGEAVSGAHARCEAAWHALVAPAGAELVITLAGWTSSEPAVLELVSWTGERLATSPALDSGESASFTMPWAGEVRLRVRPVDADADAGGTHTLEVACAEACSAAFTRYPIVLMHGMGGDDAWFDVLDYFYGVEQELEGEGYVVHAPGVDPFMPTVHRAGQWADHLDALAATGRHRRVNLVAHSQGGLDARYLAAVLDAPLAEGGQVASITTIATPHRGSTAADAVLDAAVFGGSTLDSAADTFADLMGTDDDQDILDQLEDLSTEGAAAFNHAVPDRADVVYASWAGASCGAWDWRCIWDSDGEVVSPLLAPTHAIVAWHEGPNDGLVSVDSARWGTFLGTVPADHGDEVGQFFGWTAPGFDHLAFYSDQAAWLADRGL